MFNKDTGEIKKSQSITNNAINEIKNTLEWTKSRITEAEDTISEVEDRMVEINEAESRKEKRIFKNEHNLWDLWDNVKSPNIWIIGVPEEKDKKKGHEKILEEILVENFPKLGKEIVNQVQETKRVPNKINPRWNTPGHKNQIDNDQTQGTNIKSSKGKTENNTQGDSHKHNSWSFNRNSSSQKGWQDILKVMKEENLQPWLLYPARISFKYEGEIKSFTNKQKLREFSTTKPALQQTLKNLL